MQGSNTPPDRCARPMQALILAADHHNLANLAHMLPNTQDKTRLMLEKTEVPDPYYGGLEDYQAVYNILLPALEKLLEALKLEL